jgi:hypothetical protein
MDENVLLLGVFFLGFKKFGKLAVDMTVLKIGE